MGLGCVHSYKGIRVGNNGTVTPCCYYDESKPFKDDNDKLIKTDTHTFKEMMNNPNRKKLISDLENGIQNDGCKRCWDDERNSGKSKRINDNERFEFDKELELKYLELNLGNTCNLACRMCSVGASIKWYNEHRLIHGDDDDISYKKWVKEYYKSYEDDSLFWGELENSISSVKHIDMYGGEPMLVKKQWDVLRKSIKDGHSKNQELHFNTNGTIFKEEYVEILKEFKRVVISFSIDATEDRFNYIRHHGDWSAVTDNINKWLEHKSDSIIFDVAVTVTNLNIFYLDELVDWCLSLDIHPYFIDVSWPLFYAPSNLPTSVKNSINKKFDIYLYKENIPQNVSDGITGILNSMNSKNFSKNLWGTFLTKNDLLDTSRNQDFEKTFKELNILINKNLVI
jgi:organic radical activating enzyme